MALSVRSLLFVPADNEQWLKRAWGVPADAVIADLEGGVATDRKQAARDLLTRQIDLGPPRGLLFVRINALDGPDFAADLELLRRCDGVSAVVVPKAHLGLLAASEIPYPLVPLIETAAGLQEVGRIAELPAVIRLMLGTSGLAAELGVEVDPRSPVFVRARAVIVAASAGAGIAPPIDAVWSRIRDETGLRDEASISRLAGFTAKACIHPSQLHPVTDEMVDLSFPARIRRLLGLSDDPPTEAERLFREHPRGVPGLYISKSGRLYR